VVGGVVVTGGGVVGGVVVPGGGVVVPGGGVVVPGGGVVGGEVSDDVVVNADELVSSDATLVPAKTAASISPALVTSNGALNLFPQARFRCI
jgi:hypothetical protein